jgi:hypothetical protein
VLRAAIEAEIGALVAELADGGGCFGGDRVEYRRGAHRPGSLGDIPRQLRAAGRPRRRKND